MSGKSFPVKRLALTVAAFAVVAVAGIATVAIVPALAAGSSLEQRRQRSRPRPPPRRPGRGRSRRDGSRWRCSAPRSQQTGLSRDDRVEGPPQRRDPGADRRLQGAGGRERRHAKITARLTKAVAKGTITQAQATALSSAATAGISQAHEPRTSARTSTFASADSPGDACDDPLLRCRRLDRASPSDPGRRPGSLSGRPG